MIVYVIHLSKPVGSARHYIGTTKIFKRRMALHRSGHGARLLREAKRRHINWRVVYKTWGGRKLERKLKSRHDAASLCPVCKARRRKAQAESARKRRARARLIKAVWSQ